VAHLIKKPNKCSRNLARVQCMWEDKWEAAKWLAWLR